VVQKVKSVIGVRVNPMKQFQVDSDINVSNGTKVTKSPEIVTTNFSVAVFYRSSVKTSLQSITADFHKIMSIVSLISSVTFVHPEETRTVPILQAINKCSLFQKNVTLAGASYTLQFISSLQGNSIEITNFTSLLELSTKFGFEDFPSKLSDFQHSIPFTKNPNRS
jgi:hypothetical protein